MSNSVSKQITGKNKSTTYTQYLFTARKRKLNPPPALPICISVLPGRCTARFGTLMPKKMQRYDSWTIVQYFVVARLSPPLKGRRGDIPGTIFFVRTLIDPRASWTSFNHDPGAPGSIIPPRIASPPHTFPCIHPICRRTMARWSGQKMICDDNSYLHSRR